MSFAFHCPHCSQAMECEDEWHGLQAVCPHCGERITIQTRPFRPQVPHQTTPVVQCGRCGGIFCPSSADDRNMRCPYCGQAFFSQSCGEAPRSKSNAEGIPVKWLVLGGIGVVVFFVLFNAFVGVWIGTSHFDDDSMSSYGSDGFSREYVPELSLDGEVARDYIENELPASQRQALMGYGSYDDYGDAISNLVGSGNLQGAAEYLQSYGD